MRHALLAGILLTLAYAAFADEAVNVVCPGGQYQCPSGDTCCRLSSGQWGCCLYAHAVCCSDHIHCCPSGYTCNVANGTCNRGDLLMPLATKNVAQPVEAVNVVCPGGRYECRSGETCCKQGGGKYGCCPLPMAVCCNDSVHCCPKGYKCNVAHGTCTKGEFNLPWYEKNDAQEVELQSVVCPGGQYQCPDGNTCCKLSSGQWGCCPLPNAVCCSDGQHCCPHGYTCDVSSGSCHQGELVIPWEEKNLAKPVEILPEPNIVCPGGQAQCPSGNTCCRLASGQWGCCPLPSAVCCSDHIHCCPHGYTCDISTGTCSLGEMTLPWFEKTDANVVVPEPNVVCPGGQAQCPSGNTCCRLASGQWGCCPLPSAVCCSDHIHCCPHGYTCDISTGTCSLGEMTLPWFEKTEATFLSSDSVPVPNIVCPGGRYQCPTGSTCCKLNTGAYGCCPYPLAVCCADHIHCCPHGYSCDISTATCHLHDLSLPWEPKKEAALLSDPAVPEPNIVCPGGQAQCPSGNTCCRLASGQWGCCPLPLAVCCSDHIHCCPHGYTCDISTGTCSLGEMTLPWFEKTAAALPSNGGIICPNSSSICRSTETCCMMAKGGWGCCPGVNAVCCPDKIHCCPHGTKCTKENTCVGAAGILSMVTKTKAKEMAPKVETVPWITKTLALPLGTKEGNVKCDSSHFCPDGNTCCKLASRQWGCCPLPNAVCCSDGIHCCPHGYTCDTASGRCQK
ncbi:granulins-like isoform X3 [Acanthaster planci]|nr:granulins-like isoform X3 [Acanthaster planci]XP_022079845.1 granulins-like isoform X3 [Acanthaster planci]